MSKKVLLMTGVFLISCSMMVYAAGIKIATVDLREVFYGYSKTKTMETNINNLTKESGTKHDAMVAEINKLRDEANMLSDKAKEEKQKVINGKLQALQEFDRGARKELLTKRNESFKGIIDDIQSVVNEIGAKEGYDYILDSRSVMYAKDAYNISKEVLKKLNAKNK